MLYRKDKSEVQRAAAPAKTVMNKQQTHDISPAVPFALPGGDPLTTHRNTHKPPEMTQPKNENHTRQKDLLFPSAQSAISNIPTKVSHAFNETSVTSGGQSSHSTGMMPTSATDLIRNVTEEKESYYSPKEHITALKKVAEEQTPRKQSESPKRSNRKRRKEKKPKRKRDSSEDGDDSSESDDSSDNRKLPAEKGKETDELEVLLFKKESLMKRVNLLMEQKNMMSNQREEIINNHKGSKASLSSILEENSFLIKEIGKQIGNITSMIKTVNHDIDVKRGNLKQTSASKARLESPHSAREAHKPRTEKERFAKKVTKHTERSSPSLPREAPKLLPPERKPSASPPRKHPIKSTIEASKKPPPLPKPPQYQASKNTESIHYAPHEAQRTYIRYMDQGMHWCKLCSLFCETAPEYVDHLMTESHLGRVKVSCCTLVYSFTLSRTVF